MNQQIHENNQRFIDQNMENNQMSNHCESLFHPSEETKEENQKPSANFNEIRGRNSAINQNQANGFSRNSMPHGNQAYSTPQHRNSSYKGNIDFQGQNIQ